MSEITGESQESVAPGSEAATESSEVDVAHEIQAMSDMANVLASLGPDVRQRVLHWLVARFASTNGGSTFGVLASPILADGPSDELTQTPEPDPDHFDDFADLYDVAAPRTDPERALVAAYWASREKRDFRAQEINGLLKDLGFGLSNVTDALNSLMSRKPNEVMQTRKSGAARQGRKDYRLTQAGRNRLRDMLARVAEEALGDG